MSAKSFLPHGLPANEPRSAQCKSYIEPTLKQAIQNMADREGLTFSDTVRAALLNSEEIQHELKLIAGNSE